MNGDFSMTQMKKLTNFFEDAMSRNFKYVFSNQVYLFKNFLFKNRIKEIQRDLLKENYPPDSEKLIIFLTSGFNDVNGGIMSISSIYEETEKLKELHGAESLLCTPPWDPVLLRYTKFRNRNNLYEFSEVLSYFQNPKSVMIHIPEHFCGQFMDELSQEDWRMLDGIEDLHVNILIQNIDYALENLGDIKRVSDRFENVTGTIAHEKYSNKEMREKLGFPIHKLSTFVSPERHYKKPYVEKEDILIVSPDQHPMKGEILKTISKTMPQLKVRIIQGMQYEEYKELISRAKWALTFGEGLDAYFVESIYSGAVSFSVYHAGFFTEDFKNLRTVYSNYHEMLKQMPLDMMNLNNEEDYSNYQREEFDLCAGYYDFREYAKNLELFYKGDYTFK